MDFSNLHAKLSSKVYERYTEKLAGNSTGQEKLCGIGFDSLLNPSSCMIDFEKEYYKLARTCAETKLEVLMLRRSLDNSLLVQAQILKQLDLLTKKVNEEESNCNQVEELFFNHGSLQGIRRTVPIKRKRPQEG